MNCKQCGYEIPEGANFCVQCGFPVQEEQENVINQKKQKKKNKKEKPEKKKNGKLIPIVVIAALLLVIGLGGVVWYKFFFYKPINVNAYLTMNCEGYNGYGEVSYEVDVEQMLQDNESFFGYDDMGKKKRLKLEREIAYILVGSFDKTENIYNGNKLVFSWKIDEEKQKELEEEYHVRFRYTTDSLTIKGLDALKEVDAFEGFEYSFYGYDTMGELEMSYSNPTYPVFYFEASKTEGLSNGDTITISIRDGYMNGCIYHGIIPKETSKEIKVSGLEGIVTVDAFSGLKVLTSGDIPYVTIRLDTSATKYAWEYEYSAPKIKNGEYITVSITEASKQKCLEQYGVKPSRDTKEYRLMKLDTLLCDPAYDDEAEYFVETVRKGILNTMSDNWETPEALKDVTHVGTLYSIPRGNYSSSSVFYTSLMYEVKVQQPEEEPFKYYFYVRFENLKRTESGAIEYDAYEYPHMDWFVGVDYFTRNGLNYNGHETFRESCDDASMIMWYSTVTSLKPGYYYTPN